MGSHGYPILDWLLLITAIVVFIVAIFLNSLILCILYRRRLKSTTFLLIANQTVSEILYCAVNLSSFWFCSAYIVNFSLIMSILCALINAIRDSTLKVSIFSMSVIAYERYRILYRPLSSALNTLLLIKITWILGISLSILGNISKGSFVFFSKVMYTCKIIFKVDIPYFTRGYNFIIMFTITNILPLVITAFFYYKVIRKRRKRKLSKRRKSVNSYRNRNKQLTRNKRKTTEMLIALIAWYFIISVPIYVISMVKVLLQTKDIRHRCAQDYELPPDVLMFSVLFFIGSILVNPFIILYYNPDCKQEAYRILKLNNFVKSRNDHELHTFDTASL